MGAERRRSPECAATCEMRRFRPFAAPRWNGKVRPFSVTQLRMRNGSSCPRADDGGSLSRIGSAVLRRKRPLHDKFAHALHSSVHEREMICDRGSAVRGSMTSPDVRATSRAYVAGLERHKMEEWRTNAASGPRLGASSMTNRLYSSLDERRGSGHSQLHSQASLPAYFLAGRGIGVTPTCSSAVYGAP